jgi:hypothetical protein
MLMLRSTAAVPHNGLKGEGHLAGWTTWHGFALEEVFGLAARHWRTARGDVGDDLAGDGRRNQHGDRGVHAAMPAYLTGGQMIHPRRPVLRTRKKCPPPVVIYSVRWSGSPNVQLVGESTPAGIG